MIIFLSLDDMCFFCVYLLLSSCNVSVPLYEDHYENMVVFFICMFLFPSVVMYVYFLFAYFFNI